MSSFLVKTTERPSQEEWMKEAMEDTSSEHIGMYLTHTGIVRKSAKAKVRNGADDTLPVKGMRFSYDEEKVLKAIEEARKLPGIFYIKVWLSSGELTTGDAIMQVLVGGDIRPHVIEALQSLVGMIKKECVTEEEIYQ